jgi:hypothetical protein
MKLAALVGRQVDPTHALLIRTTRKGKASSHRAPVRASTTSLRLSLALRKTSWFSWSRAFRFIIQRVSPQQQARNSNVVPGGEPNA